MPISLGHRFSQVHLVSQRERKCWFMRHLEPARMRGIHLIVIACKIKAANCTLGDVDVLAQVQGDRVI